MVDKNVFLLFLLTTVAISTLAVIFIYSRFRRKLLVLNELVKCKTEVIQNFQQALQRAQSEKEQLLGRAIKSETQLVMAKVAMAESKETSSYQNDELKNEFSELASRIMDSDSKKLS